MCACQYNHSFVYEVSGKDILLHYECLKTMERLSCKTGFKNELKKFQSLIRQQIIEMETEAMEKGFNLNEMLNQLNQE